MTRIQYLTRLGPESMGIEPQSVLQLVETGHDWGNKYNVKFRRPKR